METKFTPGPWKAIQTRDKVAWIVAGLENGEATEPIVWEMGGIDHEPNARLIAAAPALFAALLTLVRADNVNYARDTMRYEGLFDAGRDALSAAAGCDIGHHHDNSPIWTPAESAPALRDMLSLMLRTFNDTLRHGLTDGQRESMEDMSRRAALLLRETPSNE